MAGKSARNTPSSDFPKIIQGAGLNGWSKRPDKPTPPSAKPHPQPQTGGTYTVRPGDSWYRIADQQLGSGSRMQELAAVNGCTIATTIHPRQVLVLPR